MFGKSAGVTAVPSQDEILALFGMKPTGKSPTLARPKLKFAKPRFVPTGSISAPNKSIGQAIQDKTGSALRAVGLNDYDASRWAGKLFGAFNDLTPLGNATGADEGARMVKQGVTKGDLMTGLLGGGVFAANLIPFLKGAPKRKVEGLLRQLARDESGMFGGRNAATADLAALSRAETMASEGTGRQAIWDQTGWFQGADGKWRFEIPDNNITLDKWKIDPARQAQRDVNRYMQKHYGVEDFTSLPVGSPQRTEANSLYAGFQASEAKKTQLFDDVAQHPELLEAYPSLKGIGVGPETRYNLGGSWSDETGTLRVRPTSDNANSILGHELQHAVQGQEGFARGGLPESFQREIDEQIKALNNELSAAHSRLARAGGRNSPTAAPFAAEYDRIMNDRAALVQQNPRDLYRRLAGEVEARNVEKRLWFTPEQRQATPPWLTQDVPDENQIIRFYEH